MGNMRAMLPPLSSKEKCKYGYGVLVTKLWIENLNFKARLKIVSKLQDYYLEEDLVGS